jgi:hypothetical protein
MKSHLIAITILAAAFGAALPSIAQVPATKTAAYFEKTKKGRFMSEDEATKAGYKAAKDPAAKEAKADPRK